MARRSAEAAARSINLLLVALCVAYTVEPLLTTQFGRFGMPARVIGLAGLVVYAALLAHVIWHGSGRVAGQRKPWALVLAGVLALALYLRFGPGLAALPASFAGAAVLVLRPVRALAVVLVSVGSAYFSAAHAGLSPLQLGDVVARVLIVMVAIYAVGRAMSLNREIERNRAALARLAVLEERVRLARDLHDLLGHSLSVISLKGELAAKLATCQPERAAGEMTDVVDLARRSVSDVRRLVRGYRRLSLAAEVAGVSSVLEAAGVRCTVSAVPAELPEHVEDVFGWVIREASTNVLRHSHATCCTITFRVDGGQLHVEIHNDGARSKGRQEPGSAGQGLAGLTERLATVGGTLFSEHLPDRGFRLAASAPVDSVAR